jgi:hypothetical protein
MGSDEKRLVVSGGSTVSFWIILVGFRLGFPDMIVPFGWALALICVGIVGLFATGAFAIRAYFWKRRPTDFSDLEKLAMPTPRPKRGVSDILLDEYDRVSRQTLADARIRKAAELAPDMLGHVLKRDVGLAEALGWAINGEWGKPWHGSSFQAALSGGLGGSSVYAILGEFREHAELGNLTFWGKPSGASTWRLIPPSHWVDHELEFANAFGSITTGEYRDLMLDRAEVVREWPHEG